MTSILGWFAICSSSGHVLSELSAVISACWVALHGMTDSFIKLCKPLQHSMEVIHEGIKRLKYLYSSWEISPSMVWKAHTLFQKPLAPREAEKGVAISTVEVAKQEQENQ